MVYLKELERDVTTTAMAKAILRLKLLASFLDHTGQCKSTGGCYNELVVAYFGTGGGVKWRKR